MAISLQNLIDLLRQRSNTENNQVVSDQELTQYLNDSLGELYDILTTRYEDYMLTTFQAIIPNDGFSFSIPIPSGLLKLRGVDVQASSSNSDGSQWMTLYPFQLPQRNRNKGSAMFLNTVSGVSPALSYRLADSSIIMEPQQQAAGNTFQVWYTPKFNNLNLTTDTLGIQMQTQGWTEYAIVDCCIKIFNKQNMDPSAFMQEKEQLRQRIMSAAKNRDASAPKQIVNTRFSNDDLFPFGSGFGYGE